jgi:DNA helicase-2/ATP-dependent DNA helicase PcrA
MAKNNTTVVIAGPGAGKTHNMVEKVLLALNELKANKYCCVITYTNAATDIIRSRISRKIDIPPNLFIGTIHSFLNNFFILPYFSIYYKEILNDDMLECIDELIFREAVHLTGNFDNEYVRNAIEFKTEKELLKKGKICYRTSVFVSYKLADKKELINNVCGRIQFLFVDEYQDSDHFINVIFKKIIKTDSVKSYFIGDQKQNIQSITSFPLNIKGEKIKDVLYDLKKEKNIVYSEIKENWRSSNEIVDFISNFQDFSQVAKNNQDVFPVVFLNQNNLDNIYTQFEQIISKHSFTLEKDTFFKVVLADSWKDNASKEYIKKLSKLKNKQGFTEIDNTISRNLNSKYKTFEDCLVSSVKRKKKEILQELFSENLISFRKYILKLFKKYSKNKCLAFFRKKANGKNSVELFVFFTNSIKKAFREDLKLEESSNGKKIICNQLCKFIFSQSNSNEQDLHLNTFCSTIHKFKGLEATCVLVIASSLTVLKKWIETDVSNQNKISRLGYVAFSRARKLLCIACLEKLDEPIKQKLDNLNVEFSDEILEN